MIKHAAAVAGLVLIAGCAGQKQLQQVIDTQVIEKPVFVQCQVVLPKECQDRYAVDRLMPGADPVSKSRALRAEIEERAACEVKLRAALKGCNDGTAAKNETL